MKFRKVVLLLSVLMTVSLLTGCMQIEVGLELNKDNTGNMTVLTAVNKEIFMGEEPEGSTSEDSISDDLLERIPEGMDGVNVEVEPIKCTENGNVFEGEKVVMTFDNTEEFLKFYSEESDDTFKLIELPDGNKRLEMYMVINENGENKDDLTNVEVFEMLGATGGKIVYTVKTDYNVVKHNADKVENGVYTWDLLKRSIESESNESKITMFIEYDENNNRSGNIIKLSDISNHWGKSNIERLVGLNAISGYPDGTFKPNNTISFAEFLKIAVSSVEKNVKSSPKGSHWASGVYSTAIEKGIIKSSEFSGSKERFDSTISREDMALILVRLNEISQGNSKVDTSKTKGMIQDHNKIASSRTYFVEQAYQKGLLKGKGNGFDPKGNLTRAEAATAVINLLDYKEGTVIEAPIQNTENRQPMTLRYDDPNRPMAIEGDTFIKPDGTKVVLKVGPSGILGELQGVATEIGRAHPNGKLIKHGDLGSNEKYLGQPYWVDERTGEGHYVREWDEIADYTRKNVLQKIDNPKDGQWYGDYFMYQGGQWYWAGPVRS